MKISTSWHFPDQVSEQRGGEVHHQCTAVATSLLLLQQTSVQGETELEATAGKRPSCSLRTEGFLADIPKTGTDKRSNFELTWGNSMESWKTPRGVMSLWIHRQRLHLHSGTDRHHRFLRVVSGKTLCMTNTRLLWFLEMSHFRATMCSVAQFCS